MGITGTAASAPQASLAQTVGSILMSASPLHVPWAPPAWMRSMDIAAYAHQTGLDPTAKKLQENLAQLMDTSPLME